MSTRVLVVDDEATAREELCETLRDEGFEVCSAGNGEAALKLVGDQSIDICISDIRMPGIDGIELLRRLRDISPETMVIMVTAYGGLDTAIDALRLGATDYVLKPVLFEDILGKVHRLIETRDLARQVRTLRRSLARRAGDPDDSMIGEAAAMKNIKALIAKVAPTASNVLITGESGTGKELIARSIHESSERTKAPFVPINCAAIPEALLESELFGHTKGAFTGATAEKEGLLRTAGDGTIFLDEIGDMPLPLQAKLLRALESREIQPVGSVRRVSIGARIVAATHANLQAKMDEGEFREDLYYRLAVVEIQVPSLRDRKEDVPRLVAHFIEKYNRELHRACRGVDSSAMRHLVGYPWRGNIRELENTIERALIFSESDQIEVSDLPSAVRDSIPADPGDSINLAQAIRNFEVDHIQRILKSCDGDKRLAAKQMGLSLSTLYRKLESSGAEV